MMRRPGRTMGLFLAVVIIACLGLTALIRLAPSDPALWHRDPREAMPAGLPRNELRRMPGGAFLILSSDPETANGLLASLDHIALATPRTSRLAGSLQEGRVTWITRGALWGFPDYTTAQVHPDGLYVHARLRFGRSDLGVNAARLESWLSRL